MPLFALPYPAIDPVLIEIGPFAIRWYALAYIAGIFLGWWYAKRLVRNPTLWTPGAAPMKPTDIDDLVVWAAIGAIAGGRLGYIFFYAPELIFQNPLEIIAVWHGGMSFHGGFLGTILAMVIFARARGIPVWSLIDVAAPSATFGLLFGRIANFINGEVYGRASDVPWAMVFPEGGPDPRHPSQLYEAFLEGIVLFVILRFLTHRFHKLTQPGFLSGAFCAAYGVARTLVEFVREPDTEIGPLVGGLTMGMALSIPMIAFGIGLMIWASRRGANPVASKV